MRKRWNGSLWKRPEQRALVYKRLAEMVHAAAYVPEIQMMVMDMPLMQTLRIKSSQLGYDDDGRL